MLSTVLTPELWPNFGLTIDPQTVDLVLEFDDGDFEDFEEEDFDDDFDDDFEEEEDDFDYGVQELDSDPKEEELDD